MPAESEAQQKLMAMALHSPGKLYKRNRGVLKMSKGDLRDFAETKHTGIPKKKRKSVRGKKPSQVIGGIR